MIKRILCSLFAVAICSTAIVFALEKASAQIDPRNVLIGTWEGTVDGVRDNGRTIIIRSVKPNENGWEAQGFYATSASKGRGERMTFEVSRQGDDIIVEFVTSQKNPGKLKLLDDRHMEGTMNFVLAGRTTNRVIKLEKVESKKAVSN
jgi:hypothetical protein